MADFALLFRQPITDTNQSSQEDIQNLTKKWHDWIGGIAAQGKLISAGPKLTTEGKVLKSGGVITDGPFVEIRERLGGLIIIKADTLDEATTLAHGCPALESNGSVEVRPVG